MYSICMFVEYCMYMYLQVHVCVAVLGRDGQYSVAYSIALLNLKRCVSELPVRVGLICTA